MNNNKQGIGKIVVMSYVYPFVKVQFTTTIIIQLLLIMKLY